MSVGRRALVAAVVVAAYFGSSPIAEAQPGRGGGCGGKSPGGTSPGSRQMSASSRPQQNQMQQYLNYQQLQNQQQQYLSYQQLQAQQQLWQQMQAQQFLAAQQQAAMQLQNVQMQRNR